jgi:D-alanine-D-alanine ligase
MKKNVVVFFGGKSVEHDISIISAMQVIRALNQNKYNIIPIYLTKDNKWLYNKNMTNIDFFKDFNEKKCKKYIILPNSNILYEQKSLFLKKVCPIDFAFIIMHGAYGEDGTIQGLLNFSNIPYSSSTILGSALTMDKCMMKKIFRDSNFPILDYELVGKYEWEIMDRVKFAENLEYPVIVKPNSLGSSIGITFCKTATELIQAVDLAVIYDNKVIIEKGLTNFDEYNCSAMGNDMEIEISNVENPIHTNNYLSFSDKYLQNGKISKTELKEIKKIDIPNDLEKQIKNLTLKSFKDFNLCGIMRCDFMFDKDNQKLYINEINSIPGSLAYYLWKDRYNFTELLDKCIKFCTDEFNYQNSRQFIFDSSVLYNI